MYENYCETEPAHAYAGLVKCDTNYATVIEYWSSEVPEDRYWKADYAILHKRSYWRNLNGYNMGIRNGAWTNKDYQTREMNQHVIDNVSERMGLNPRQKVRAQRTYAWLKNEILRQGTVLEVVASAAIAYVLHTDQEYPRPCHPNNSNRDVLFLQTIEELGISLKLVDRAIRKTFFEGRGSDKATGYWYGDNPPMFFSDESVQPATSDRTAAEG